MNNKSHLYCKRWDLLFIIFTLLLFPTDFTHAENNNNSLSPCGEGRGGVFFLEKSREHFEKENYDSALFYLNKVELRAPRQGKTEGASPELEAAVHEQYCLIFSALNDKQQSDYHRNMYLDVKEHARQDLNLERHADELHGRMRLLMFKTVLLIIATIVFIIAFFYFRKLFTKDKEGNKILKKKEYREKNEELQEQIAVLSHQLQKEKRQGAEKRAKLSLLQSVSPLIARLRYAMANAIDHCAIDNLPLNDTEQIVVNCQSFNGQQKSPSPCGEGWGGSYIHDLLTEIERYNALLTDWIRLEQGKLSLKIETFSLSELQDILQKNAHSFALQGITLNVNLPDIKVKADKVLTLFMLNTLADNARKATPKGGTVTIKASVLNGSVVELSTEDTGRGMTEEETANIFSHTINNGHGFGLQNCRGIINSYKKAGTLFKDCMIGAESTLGKGSRFFFRLPIAKLFLLLLTFNLSFNTVSARPTRYTETITDPLLRQAANYADSAYYSNIDNNYEQTILYVDSAQICLMQCFSDSILIDDITVDISNEAAVAALALHRWEDYRTYNNTYENAFRRLTESDELVRYCREKEAYLENIKYTWRVTNICALAALLLLIISLLARYIHKRRMLRLQETLDIEGKLSEIRRLTYETEALHIANNIMTNGLSTIKHETMYYPARIKALIDSHIIIDNCPIDNLQLNETEQTDVNQKKETKQTNVNQKKEAEQIDVNRQTLELVNFYEQLYNNLLQQMTIQKLYPAVRPNDPELREYLDTLINKHKGQTIDPNDCFTPKAKNIPLLIARQIMRDLSTSDSRGNGIIIENNQIRLNFNYSSSTASIQSGES